MDWPQVAQAIAESGAFVVALVLAIGGGIRNRKLAEENRELRKAQRDRELRQEAESVSAWVSDEWLPDHERNTYKRSVTLHVANQGSTPVFEVTGWKGASDDDLAELGRKLARYGPATFVNYPAPQVAYVRIPLVEPDETDEVVGKDGVFLPAQILTLTFSYDRGWRVYQVGPSLPPDVLRFARKTF
jgi:hypothetical protein